MQYVKEFLKGNFSSHSTRKKKYRYPNARIKGSTDERKQGQVLVEMVWNNFIFLFRTQKQKLLYIFYI